ncbi:lyase family protein [Streptomyces sp. WMMC905]|uniref:lyase family protein n=1 Tax=Streptomyces sp. WMMC905 TaxID=3404123 RepID=UPI003B96645F
MEYSGAVSSLTDAGLLSPVRAGTPVEAAVCDAAWLRAMLDAEAGLARAQATLGTLPRHAAEVITASARAERFDLRALAVAARETANPVVGLVRALTAVVAAEDPAAAEYVHRGSTSQDILDTGAMLIAARALEIIRADVRAAADAAGTLAATHRDTPAVARTLGLHAVPTTFGLRAAGWRRLLLDAERRLSRVLSSGLPVSLGGAAGTLAGYLEYATIGAGGHKPRTGEYVDRLIAAFAAETGLTAAPLPWHALRTPMADLGAVLGFTAGALGKTAVDVQSLARTEVGEVAEPGGAGRGGSSAMPHKRNPVLATLVRSSALQVPALTAALTQCLVSEDERSAGVWHAEWNLLRECLRLTGGAAHTAVELLSGLEVRPGRMRENLRLTASQVVSERVAAALSPLVGRERARSLLAEASARVHREGRGLGEVIRSLPDVADLPEGTVDELVALCDPTGYTGAASALVERSLRG